jgi:hypothetical protein
MTHTEANPFDTFGDDELCTWRVGPGISRFQTRRPDLARKLSQRRNTHLVAWSIQGGYLRVFQEEISPRAARNLVNRYLGGNRRPKKDRNRTVTPTNARFLGRNAVASASKLAGSIRVANDEHTGNK